MIFDGLLGMAKRQVIECNELESRLPISELLLRKIDLPIKVDDGYIKTESESKVDREAPWQEIGSTRIGTATTWTLVLSRDTIKPCDELAFETIYMQKEFSRVNTTE